MLRGGGSAIVPKEVSNSKASSKVVQVSACLFKAVNSTQSLVSRTSSSPLLH